MSQKYYKKYGIDASMSNFWTCTETQTHPNLRISDIKSICQARVLVLVIVLDSSLRLVSIPVSKGPELKL